MIIRDAIHGSIEFNELEEKIINHPLLQRLRRVRQLSQVHLVYPSALHTRFEHSLGSMHLTGKLASRLRFDAGQTKLVRLAALLHDVGHGAFSHTSDTMLTKLTGKTHEQRGIDTVRKSELAGILEENGVSPDALEKCLAGEGNGALLTSELGTDRMDYLLRDAYFTGVSYSSGDHQRLLETLEIKGGELVVQEKGVVAAESLLVSRQLMFNAVYLHPAVRIGEAMVEKMLEQALGEKQITLDGIAFGTDDNLLEALSTQNSLAKRLLERRLYKKAFVMEMARASAKSKGFLSPEGAEKAIGEEIQKAIGSEEFVVCLPPQRKKHTGIRVLEKDGAVEELEKYSNLLNALNLESGRDSLIVACAEKDKDSAKKVAERLLAQ